VIGSSHDIGSGRGEPDDQSQSFLKKKEEELRQKRERERQTAESRSKQSADVAVTSGLKVTTPTVTLGAINKLEFVAVTAVTLPLESVSTSLVSVPSRTSGTTELTSSASRTPKAVSASTTPPIITAGSYPPAKPLPGVSANIPQFYFPLGLPTSGSAAVDVDEAAMKIKDEFEKADDGKLTRSSIGPIVKVLTHIHAETFYRLVVVFIL